MAFLNKGKNLVINGAMDNWQRGTSFASAISGQYAADRFFYMKGVTAVHTISRDTDVPTLAQSGFIFPASYKLSLTTSQSSLTASQYCGLCQRIEGQVFAPLAGKKLTLSFWVKAALAGSYTVAVGNGGQTRSYVMPYTINLANTWEKKVMTFTHDTTGTWDYTTAIGLQLYFMVASTLQAGSANTWVDGVAFGFGTQTNGVQASATSFNITGIMLEEGGQASNFERAGGSIDAEFQLCQRYYEQCTVATSGTASSTFSRYSAVYRNRKRVSPNLAFTIIQGQNAAAPSSSFTTVDGAYGHSNGGTINDWTAWTLSADAEL